MKHKKNSIRWIYPFLEGVIIFNLLRAITDLTKNESFWKGDMRLHLISLFFSILFCYIYDFIWRYQLSKPEFLTSNHKSIAKEYLLILLELIALNIPIMLGEQIGIFLMGNGVVDYMLINFSFIFVSLLYYTFMRNDAIKKNDQKKIVLLEKLKAENSETELKFLKSQYHPHFLFNALNTIYFQINEENKTAKHSIELLSDLLRYQIYDINKKVTMDQEINYIKSYIEFQQLRMTERLVFNPYFDPELGKQKIHPLLFQPLIENAFKYVGGSYQMSLECKLCKDQIRFIIQNSISSNKSIYKKEKKGIGIENLKRRLDLLYTDKHNLEMKQTEDYFIARLIIDIN